MSDYKVALDAHKRYSVASVVDGRGKPVHRGRIEHQPGAIRAFCEGFPEGTPVAVESVGHWYWIVDEIEAAACEPKLAHARKAKLMMGQVNKTDRLDADGLVRLLHNGTLPTVWIPPAAVRDERELPRTRMALSHLRTSLKNRLHATLAKYGCELHGASDIFSPKWRPSLEEAVSSLPPETQRCARQVLSLIGVLRQEIGQLEGRIRERTRQGPNLSLLKTLPGVGDILAIVIDREVGLMQRFPSPRHFAGYAGTTPKVRASGGRVRFGPMRAEANQYLKWAFVEAANTAARYHLHPQWRDRHVCRVYRRIRSRKGHGIAIGAVARHLSEAAFWVLTRQQAYQEREPKRHLPTQGQARE